MPNGIYLTLEQYKDKDLPITITINGHTYHSQFALATAQTTWFEMGKQHGMELGADNTYSDKEMSRMHDQWYNEGYADGYKQGKQAGISKINLNTEPVEQTELSKEYDKGFTKGYEEGFEEGKSEGYEIGKKANGISKKEIPGEYLSHIEEAYDDGYKEGYTDCREVAKMLNKYGIDEDGPCNDCKEEPGRDEEDGELIGPEHPEYDKGYYAGWEDGKNHIMQFIGQ
jgi:flagellar biosynthesis/type III secretory pathway protein FliH